MTIALPVHSLTTPKTGLRATICESDIPLSAALSAGPKALAVITGVVGASYRPLGACMVCDEAGNRTGNLSSGCIERDVALHAALALKDGEPRRLRYGQGSPYRDLTLPCGGGLDVLILPNPDKTALAKAATALADRQSVSLDLLDITLEIRPELRFLIFGKGPETRALSHLAHAAGYLVKTFSPDPETLAGLPNARPLTAPIWPHDLKTDPRTAVALFFHDHDWEPPLLSHALRSDAFYIGAQGSKRAHESRCMALQDIGMTQPEIERLASPFGLIPSVRDPKTLAVSVLSHVLDRAQTSRG